MDLDLLSWEIVLFVDRDRQSIGRRTADTLLIPTGKAIATDDTIISFYFDAIASPTQLLSSERDRVICCLYCAFANLFCVTVCFVILPVSITARTPVPINLFGDNPVL